MKLENLTILQLHKLLLSKELSALELTKFFLEKIEQRNKVIFAFLSVFPEYALEQAKKVDDLILAGAEIHPLAGIPIAIKDNILVKDLKCTAGSKILENYIAPYDAAAVKKLKEVNAVIIGKTNLDEFAMGSSTEHSAFGPTKNPHNLFCVPGGSSGGSAAAVADSMVPAALGSDTGGSIRQPASFCGVVGLKPTYGAVSRYGLIAMASSLDQIGPITKTVEDARIIFEVIKGKDPKDSTSLEIAKSEFSLELSEFKIGVPKEYFIEGMDPEVEKLITQTIKRMEGLGVKIEEISLPHTEYALPTYYIIMPSEVSANLARYDGMKYGRQAITEAKASLLEVYLKTRGQYLGPEVRRRIMLGTYTLSAGYYDAYYLRAQKVRTLIKQDFEEAFKKVDLIVTPTSPTTAFKLGEKTSDPLTMYLADIFTISCNLAGLPGISIPIGKLEGLPVGIQLMAKPFDEEKLFAFAEILEKEINYYGSVDSTN